MIDVAKIKIKGGNGGDGAVSFLQARYIAKGGPDGGDGGKGGHVYFVADSNMATLRDFTSKELFAAESGEKGGKKKMFGKDGHDLFIKVPLGTLVYEQQKEREVLLADLSENGQKFLGAKGGAGGRGNHHFKSSTNQTPVQYVEGIPGEEKSIRLEIRLVADVGLIGMPNAGKSTLINRLTNANAKVANYPFTTLIPNLGVYRGKDGRNIILADIPGLIEGASEGKGLGDEFLRHVRRTRVLVHLIDITDCPDLTKYPEESWARYQVIRKELVEYGGELESKPEITIINKLDVTEVKEEFSNIKKYFSKKKVSLMGVSAVTGEGVDELIQKIQEVLEKTPKTFFEPATPVKVYNIDTLPNKKAVFKKPKIVELVKPKH